MKRILITVCFFACLYSCSNDDSITPETPDSNFYALTVGNSWVYRNYRYDQNSETYEDTGVVDSLSVIGTEVIDGNTYYQFRRFTTGNEEGITLCNPNGEHFEFLREIDGNLTRDDGSIKFTNKDYSLRILSENNWGNVVEQLIEGETTLEVEAGTFDCINSELYAILPDGSQSPGLDRFYYADGIGLIYDTISFVTNATPRIIRRLDTYDIQ
jgi:hypothetical protein